MEPEETEETEADAILSNEEKGMLFINVTGRTSKNRDVQRRIRSHVMKDIGRARRAASNAQESQLLQSSTNVTRSGARHLAPKPHATQLPQPHDFVLSLRREHLESSHASGATLGMAEIKPSQIVDWTFAGNADPFVRYPVELTPRIRRLLSHVFDASSIALKPHRDIFFPMGLLDAAAFHTVLGNFALYLRRVRPLPAAEEYESSEAHFHQYHAIKLVIERITGPTGATSDGLIAAVIAMGCHANVMRDIVTLNVHNNGLRSIVRLRGGEETLFSNPMLHLALVWFNINTCTLQDIKPHFRLPLQFANQRPIFTTVSTPATASQLAKIRSYFHEEVELGDIMEDTGLYLFQLQTQILSQEVALQGDQIFVDGGAGRNYFNPLLHRLLRAQLTIPSSSDKQQPNTYMAEALRLGLILSLAQVRRLFGVQPITSTLLVRKLRFMMENCKWEEPIREFGLWVATVGLLEAVEEDRAWFTEEFARRMRSCALEDVREGESVVSSLPWCTVLHGPMLRQIIHTMSA